MRLKLFFIVYRLAWIVLLPLVLVYLWRRGRRDSEYRRHLHERFGFYRHRPTKGAIWFHAVSLGETRSATGLIHALLDRGDRVLLTHFTPAGRRESHRLFAGAIAAGQLQVVWVPFDMAWCLRRFLRAFQPRIGLTLEVEIWPSMIFATRAANVPLYLCNGQYPDKSFQRDSRGLQFRILLMQRLAGALVKSELQVQRFIQIGVRNVRATGELRFDQPVPEDQVQAARLNRANLGLARDVVTIASGVEDEEPLYCELISRMRDRALVGHSPPPLFIYVPRAPERFDAVADNLSNSGLNVVRRSQVLDKSLRLGQSLKDADVLLGDSLGEMFFYLELADRVVVGGGFTPRGAHNIIEPLMLGKSVLVGPHIWTIEYPFREAERAGIVTSLPDIDHLFAALMDPTRIPSEKIARFLDEHGSSSIRTLAAIDSVLKCSEN